MDNDSRLQYYNAAAGFIRRYAALARQAARHWGFLKNAHQIPVW